MKEVELSAQRSSLWQYPFTFVISSALAGGFVWVAVWIISFTLSSSGTNINIWVALTIGAFINAIGIAFIEVRLHRKILEAKTSVDKAMAELEIGGSGNAIRNGLLIGIQNSKLLGLDGERKGMIASYSKVREEPKPYTTTQDVMIESIALSPTIVLLWPFFILYAMAS